VPPSNSKMPDTVQKSHLPHSLGCSAGHGAVRVAAPSRLRRDSMMDPVPLGTNSLAAYICEGPLLHSCGITPLSVHTDISKWEQIGEQLAKQMGFNHELMDTVQKLRVYHYYLPVYFWCESQLITHRASGLQQPLVIGISAPQGCGKTTLVEQLQLLFQANECNAASVSIDDFYLTYKDQTALATANPTNALLKFRGNAGTHDLSLGTATLQGLKQLIAPGSTVPVPRYDKSAHAGRGDRAAPGTWPNVEGPLDVLLFEGWMSGFKPLETDELAEAVDPSLVAVNAALRAYEAAWDAHVDSWLVVRIGDPNWVFKWRLQAEEAMRASGKEGMTDAQIADFVARFQPAYQAYLPHLYAKGPTTAQAGRTLVIQVDEHRSPIEQQPEPVL